MVVWEAEECGDGGRRTHGAGAGRNHGASEKEENLDSRPVIRVSRGSERRVARWSGGWPGASPGRFSMLGFEALTNLCSTKGAPSSSGRVYLKGNGYRSPNAFLFFFEIVETQILLIKVVKSI